MNKEKQRIAIAEACGTKLVEALDGFWDVERNGKMHAVGCYKKDLVKGLPDYLTDLNAMHEAMAHLEPEQVDQFAVELSGIVLENRKKYWWDLTSNEVGHVANATAAQRAEAFLKTVGKWEDDK